MKSIGIRELRQRASEFLRLVGRGETIKITDRGRSVALLVPVPHGGVVGRLDATGRLSAADGDLLELGPPIRPRRGTALPSKALAEARAHER
ncbi:MAG: type II toxin-antitoxin system Phd/YefM family antitoxin [Planctomycetota bacterium]